MQIDLELMEQTMITASTVTIKRCPVVTYCGTISCERMMGTANPYSSFGA